MVKLQVLKPKCNVLDFIILAPLFSYTEYYAQMSLKTTHFCVIILPTWYVVSYIDSIWFLALIFLVFCSFMLTTSTAVIPFKSESHSSLKVSMFWAIFSMLFTLFPHSEQNSYPSSILAPHSEQKASFSAFSSSYFLKFLHKRRQILA